jgi:hypothetical protein
MNKSSHDPENGDLIYVLSRQLTAEYGRGFSFMANPAHGVSAFIRVHLRFFIIETNLWRQLYESP